MRSDDSTQDQPTKREAPAGFRGRPANVRHFKQNGRRRTAVDFDDPADPRCETPLETPRLNELRRRVAKTLSQYRRSGSFSEFELELMTAMFDGISMEEFGKKYEMDRQLVWYYIVKLLSRAKLFEQFWKYRNRMKARK